MSRPEGAAIFVVDPWTQRWAVLADGSERVLGLADGTRSLDELAAAVAATAGHPQLRDAAVVRALARRLKDAGLLFVSAAHHAASGTPVISAPDPIGFHLEITNACNLRCRHCYVSSGRRLPRELTEAELLGVVDQLPPFSGKRLVISGGEALVRRGCLDLVEYAALERGLDIDLYSNAYRIERRTAERLAEIADLAPGDLHIQVSLEGATPATNDAIRGEGVFGRVSATMEMFRDVGLNRRVKLLVCVTRHNIAEVGDVIALAERWDVARVVFSQWQRQGNAAGTPWATIAPTLAEWVAAGERVLAHRHPRLDVTGNFFGDLNNDGRGRFTTAQAPFPKHLYGYGLVPRIAPDGEIFADQLWVDPGWSLGNVRHITVAEALESVRFAAQLAAIRTRPGRVEECRGCEWFDLCESGSPGHTYAEYGDLDHKDVFCEARKYWFERFLETQVAEALNGP